MRRAFIASLGFALTLVLMGCGEETPSADKGEIHVQVRGELSEYSSMSVRLTSETEPTVTFSLTKEGDTFVGSQSGITPGTWTGQLQSRGFFGNEDVGSSIEIEIQAGITTKAIFVVPESAQNSESIPQISSIVISSSKVPTFESISVQVSLAAAGSYTVTGSAAAAAGSFGAATGTGPYTLEFTAGGTLGFYDLTVTATKGGDSDSVIFEIEVIDGAGPGIVEITAMSGPAPTVEIESEKVVTSASVVMGFEITATAKGQAAGENLSWSFLVENSGSFGGNCDQGTWTVGGTTTEASASGTMASGASLSARLSIASSNLAGGRTDCPVTMTFTDSVGGTFTRHYTVKRTAPNVTFED